SSYDDTGTNYGFEEKHQYWYHGDHLGSAQLITNYQGLLHERIEYAPYGELWIEHRYEADSFALPYLFTGKELDPETNLYYYGARYLDPKRSRWISTDPAMGEYIPGVGKGLDGLPNGGVYNSLNLHTFHYSNNNPITLKDPDGNSPKDWVSSWMAKPDSQGGKSISADAPQRHFGYSGFYESFTSNDAVCDIDSVRVSFKNTDGGNVQLWFWKGNYNLVDKQTWDEGGVVKNEWHMGGEIGTYSGSGPWAPALDNAVLSMSYSLFEKGNDTPLLTRNSGGEYWANGFSPGKAESPGNLVMQGQLKFRSVAAAKAFEKSAKGATYYAGQGSAPSINIERAGRIVNFTFE
ncbi:MAG: RHS repeat-associated core domain-containing protein, partial [Treponema sp.]|nr:RHS repeat-associated core domain-containing protein [Treponema sp.]